MDQENPKKKFYKRWWFWVGAVFVLFIIIGSSGSSSKSGTSVPAQAETGSTVAAPEKKATASAPVPAAVTPQVLLDLSGNGTKTTQKFTAGKDWDLNWSYNCSNFGQDGNFQVFIYDDSGQLSFRNSPVNQLGASGADVEHYHNGGTFYLTVNSVCSWKIQVNG
jgi:hypothetical protein